MMNTYVKLAGDTRVKVPPIIICRDIIEAICSCSILFYVVEYFLFNESIYRALGNRMYAVRMYGQTLR